MNRADLIATATANAATRLNAVVERIKDSYGVEEPDGLTRQEVQREMQLRGHVPPGDGCTSAVCVKARRMLMSAINGMEVANA